MDVLSENTKDSSSYSPNEEITATASWSFTTLCDFFHKRYGMRVLLQKVEFLVCWWGFGMALAVFPDNNPSVCRILEGYIKASLISRFVAYAFDFSRAYSLTKSLPSWLILHHSGVCLQHFAMGYLLLEDTYRNPKHKPCTRILALVFLALQASHNTWTKSISKAMYWGNAFGIGLGSSLVLGVWFLPPPTTFGDLQQQPPQQQMQGIYYYWLGLAMTAMGMLKMVGWNRSSRILRRFSWPGPPSAP